MTDTTVPGANGNPSTNASASAMTASASAAEQIKQTNTKPKGFWNRVGNFLNGLRYWLGNLVFVLLLGLIAMMWMSSCQSIQIPSGAALVLDPQGIVVENAVGAHPLQGLLSGSSAITQTELSDLLNVIESATVDDRIAQLVLRLDNLVWLSTAHAQTLGDALTAFKATGKTVTSYGYFFGQPQYLLASYADAVYLHPLGELMFEGFSSYQMFYKDLIDKLQVDVNVFRVGTYKSFVEPYQRNDMSQANREATSELVAGLWDIYASQVAQNRALEPAAVDSYLNDFPAKAQAVSGDLARAALEANLVDELLSEDEVRARIAQSVGRGADGSFLQVDLPTYQLATQVIPDVNLGPHISVITAEGQIVMRSEMPGVIAADTMSRLIRQARRDTDSRALVLRVDSPGGSAFASELIRQELELYQLSERPVVVSMGNTAASGGYWISATSDHILAEPSTITGSIGVFGILPTFEDTLNLLGVHVDGVGVGPFAGATSPFKALNEPVRTVLQAGVENTYDRFLNLVARGRDMDKADVDAVAQGRVWLGSKALELGLVDGMGSLNDAIGKAATLAELDDPKVVKLELPMSTRERILRTLFEAKTLAQLKSLSGALAGGFAQSNVGNGVPGQVSSNPASVFGALAQQLRTLDRLLDDPQHRYALCDGCRPL